MVFPPSSGSFPGLFRLSLVFFYCPSLFPYVSSCGVAVAGPHPSQTTALMVPCSVQPSALRFCQSEHQICGGWKWSPPPPNGTSQIEKAEGLSEAFLYRGGLYHGSEGEIRVVIRVIWNIFHSDRIQNGVLYRFVYWTIAFKFKYDRIFEHPSVFVIPSSPLLPWGLLQSSVVVYITLTWGYCAFPFKINCILKVNGIQKCSCWKISAGWIFAFA